MSTCAQPTIRVSNIGISFYIYGRLQAADDTSKTHETALIRDIYTTHEVHIPCPL